MSAIKIDTLAIAKELEESGIPMKQAEAQTRVYAKVLNMVVEDQLATKQDVIALERKLEQEFTVVKQDLNSVEHNLKEEISAVEYKLTKKMDDFERLLLKLDSEMQTQVLKITVRLGGLVVAGILVLAALMKL